MTDTLIVTDSTVLIGLERIGSLDVLPATFSNVAARPAVIAEFGICPDWLRLVSLRDPSRAEALALHKLDLGEREAIALAQEHAGSLLLIDERRGRRYAIAAGLQVVGTAGLLVRAKRTGAIVAVRPVLDALRTSGFRLGDAVYLQTLAAADEAD